MLVSYRIADLGVIRAAANAILLLVVAERGDCDRFLSFLLSPTISFSRRTMVCKTAACVVGRRAMTLGGGSRVGLTRGPQRSPNGTDFQMATFT